MLQRESEANLGGLRRPSGETGDAPAAKRRSSSASHQRALKACEACRKAKTKCFKTSSVSVRCVRCTSSKLVCSLESEYKRYNPDVSLVDGVPEHLLDSPVENATFPVHFIPKPDQVAQGKASDSNTNDKLDAIYRGVSDLLYLMKSQCTSTAHPPLVNNDVKLLLDAANSMKKKSEPFIPPVLADPLPQDPLSLFPSGISRFGFPSANVSQYPALDNSALDKLRNESSESLQNSQCDASVFSSSSRSFNISPLNVVAKTMSNIPRPIANLLNLSTTSESDSTFPRKPQYDIVTCGIISENEAIALMDDFRSNYGRWVSFPIHISTKTLVNQIRRKSSLLLSTSCSLSLRYSLNGKPSPGDIDNHRRKKETYKAVIKHLVEDLNKSLLKYAAYQNSKDLGGDVEFLQSMVILSIYSLSLSSIVSNTVDPESLLDEDSKLRDLNLDPWYLSGLGLSTFISKSTFGNLFDAASSDSGGNAKLSPTYIAMYDELTPDHSQLLTLLRIYNHLVLIHLVSCVLSGRMCMVDEIRLNHCTSTLSLPSATNFDGRMVSEIGILLITYNFIQINSNLDLSKGTGQLEASLQSVDADIKAWYEQWEYLFEQPALQFGQFCYNFCYLQIMHNYVFHKAQASSENDTAQKNGTQGLCDTDNLSTLLKYASDVDLSKILLRSYNLTHFVTKVENDSYFAYLSDQIHFFFFYGAMSLVIVLKFLKDNDKLSLLDGISSELLNDWKSGDGELGDWKLRCALRVVDLLSQKFDRVAQDNPNDIITKYKNSISDCIGALFPNI
ncbi:hypothetical protein JCM33374_g6243 [Metschnikowia sp. JCM 33374]|nr:hypothetical protein JCM33374_g6243 [Metschnikowia sp. JCM 33374]